MTRPLVGWVVPSVMVAGAEGVSFGSVKNCGATTRVSGDSTLYHAYLENLNQ
jgi:hypothetical protein